MELHDVKLAIVKVRKEESEIRRIILNKTNDQIIINRIAQEDDYLTHVFIKLVAELEKFNL